MIKDIMKPTQKTEKYSMKTVFPKKTAKRVKNKHLFLGVLLNTKKLSLS